MAIISSLTIIRTVSLIHIIVAYFFLTAPRLVADHNIVYALGESMNIRHAESIVKPTESTAFIGVVLAFLGIADVTAASMDENIAIEYWLANVPARLAFLFGLTGYVYLFKEDGMLAPQTGLQPSTGDPLRNSLVFSFGFFEVTIWFWAFISLREERRELIRKRIEAQKADEGRL